ncbi:MAG: hypothetical protein ACD_75C01618G0004 [uncultured bacterium]|nr:MAG: hypothetical protein ACD_75C01618G0004 [uncultured bacterium]
MSQLNYQSIQIGDEIPAYTTPPISRTTLALYAGASGDHNQIHIDSDFAKKCGMPDVFAHGMLNMAYLGRLLTGWVTQRAIRQYGVRFAAIARVGDRISCHGRVTEKYEKNGEKLVELAVTAVNQDGDVKLSGRAVIALP